MGMETVAEWAVLPSLPSAQRETFASLLPPSAPLSFPSCRNQHQRRKQQSVQPIRISLHWDDYLQITLGLDSFSLFLVSPPPSRYLRELDCWRWHQEIPSPSNRSDSCTNETVKGLIETTRQLNSSIPSMRRGLHWVWAVFLLCVCDRPAASNLPLQLIVELRNLAKYILSKEEIPRWEGALELPRRGVLVEQRLLLRIVRPLLRTGLDGLLGILVPPRGTERRPTSWRLSWGRRGQRRVLVLAVLLEPLLGRCLWLRRRGGGNGSAAPPLEIATAVPEQRTKWGENGIWSRRARRAKNTWIEFDWSPEAGGVGVPFGERQHGRNRSQQLALFRWRSVRWGFS